MSKIEWLRAGFTAKPRAVDREAKVLRGMLIAQAGNFKSSGRGSFSPAEIEKIVRLGNESGRGLRSNFTHSTVSDDGLGKGLGRVRDLFLDSANDPRTNKRVVAARGDLHFNPTALKPPPGGGTPYGEYVMDLAESDAGLISSSLVLEADEEVQLDAKGNVKLDENGNPLPPAWIVKRLHNADIVSVGDAVHDDLLSAPELAQALSVGLTPELQKLFRFDRVARLGSQLLDGMFPKKMPRQEVAAKCAAFLQRYLDGRYGEKPARPRLAERQDRLAAMRKVMEGT